jgi:hypothetical protein
MNPTQLKNNDELLDYLLRLSGELSSEGEAKLAEEVKIAGRFASGSPSEFLYEAQEVLEKVRINCASTLNEIQLAGIARVIQQIETAFQKVGGA